MATRNETYRGIVLAAGILAIALLANARGYLAFVNGAIYDWISMIPLRSVVARESPVVLIDFDTLDYHGADEQWLALAETLSRSAKPKQIVLLERPSRLQPHTYRRLASFADIVGVVEFPWLLPDATVLGQLQAWTNAPISDHGVFRRIALTVPNDRPSGDTLLFRAAAGHSGRSTQLTEIFPNFLSGGNRPPRIHAERFIRGEIPSSLIDGKTLLLAPTRNVSAPQLFTPGGQAGVTDVAAFKARALHSLLTNRYILQFPFSSIVAFVTVLAIGCLVFYQRASLMITVYATAGMCVLFFAAAVALLHFSYLSFPVSEVLITVLGMWITVVNRKYVAEQKGMLLELNNISQLMKKRLVPADVLHSDSYWEKIAYMVQGLLQLDRSIFLETLPEERRVREIYAINCELSDIDERRRDYERRPYTTALRARAPIIVDQYLAAGSGDEHQYLVPLQVDGKVLGFWAFSVLADQLDPLDGKLDLVSRLADDISELLYERLQIREGDDQDRRRGLDFLTFQGRRSLARDLKAALAVTTKRLSIIEDLFEYSQTAYLLYDTFGQLLLNNRAAVRLCESLGIEAYELSYADTVSQLTGTDLESAKNALQRVMIDGDSVSMPLRQAADQRQNGRLTLTALLKNGPGTAGEDRRATSTFAVSGLVMEVWLPGQTLEPGGIPRWVRSLFSMQAELSADRDAGERLSRSRVDDIAALSTNSDRFLKAIDHASAESGELCTLAQAINEATDQNQLLARKKRLAFEFSDTGSAILPMLPPRTLGEIISGIIEFAMQDAKLGSVITIEVLREWPTMHLRITNDGIGIPSQRLEEIQNPNGRNRTELPRYRAAVRRFNGRLDVTSSVGKTTIIDLYLPSIPAIVRAS